MALNDKNEVIAFEFLNLGKFTDALKNGKTPEEAMTQVGAVVEGYYAARSAHLLATRLGADLPITAAAYRVLHQGADVAWTVNQLLCRDKRAETEDASWDAQWNM